MRWRVVALVALFALAVVPAASDAAQPNGTPTLHVTVTPRVGSLTTRFVVSFRATHATGRIGATNRAYRINASVHGKGGCRSSVSTVAAHARAHARVRVVLAPGASQPWCAGTFRGQVWDVLSEPCPLGEACPAILPLPRLVGRFSFRVTRG